MLLVARPFVDAALPPLPIEEDVLASPVEVAPTPTVDADVPPAAAEPAVPPTALPWAMADPAKATEPTNSEIKWSFRIVRTFQGEEVLTVHPLTVIVLENVPLPPLTLLELDTFPPPA